MRALDRVSLRIEAGEHVAVMGPSGSGKSTLLHLAGGLDRPNEGSVSIAGVDPTTLSDRGLSLLRRNKVGFVFQAFHLLPSFTVEENVALPLLLRGALDRRARARVQELLERLGIAARSAHYPEELSGGELQRAALARALVGDPPLLLADEPTGSLDSVHAVEILDLLGELAGEAGRTLVLATHDPLVAERAERTIRLRDGRLDGSEP